MNCNNDIISLKTNSPIVAHRTDISMIDGIPRYYITENVIDVTSPITIDITNRFINLNFNYAYCNISSYYIDRISDVMSDND